MSAAKSGVSLAVPVLLLLFGCSTSDWADTGQQGPWSEPGERARVLSREFSMIGAPTPMGTTVFQGAAGRKRNVAAIHRELDRFFKDSQWLQQWPGSGHHINSIEQRAVPYHFFLVALEPTVVVGVEDPERNGRLQYDFSRGALVVGSTYLDWPIEVRTTFPFAPGRKVVWFRPGQDLDVQELAMGGRPARLLISSKEQILVVPQRDRLETVRVARSDAVGD